MLRKLSILLLLILFLSVSAMCQYYSGGLSTGFNLPRTQYVVDSASGNLLFKKGDVGFTLQAGTVFAGNFRGSSSFGTYISPALAYNVSSRFRLKTGVTVFQNFGDPYYSGFDYYTSPVMHRGTTTSLFVQGDYLLSNKLMLSGTLYKDFNALNSLNTDPRLKVPESQGMILNLNYRPTEHFEINASFGYGQGNRQMLNSPFYPGSAFPYSQW